MITQEHKENISRGKKGWNPSETTRKRMSSAKLGKNPHNKGKPHSEEHKKKLREAWVLRKQKALELKLKQLEEQK